MQYSKMTRLFKKVQVSLSSPLEDSRTVLLDERLVVRLQLLHIRQVSGFCVKIIFVEFVHPGQHFEVFVVAQLHVVSMRVPGVEGMEADHVQSFLWDGAVVELQNSVQIFIVTPGHEHFVKPTVWLINSTFGVVFWVGFVWIIHKRIVSENNVLLKLAANGKRIPYHGPLRLVPQSHDFAHIMDEADELEPVFVGVVSADSLCGLEGVEGVGEVHVRVGLIHQLIQRHYRLHHPHLTVVEAGPLRMLLLDEAQGLVGVHEFVGLEDSLDQISILIVSVVLLILFLL